MDAPAGTAKRPGGMRVCCERSSPHYCEIFPEASGGPGCALKDGLAAAMDPSPIYGGPELPDLSGYTEADIARGMARLGMSGPEGRGKVLEIIRIFGRPGRDIDDAIDAWEDDPGY